MNANRGLLLVLLSRGKEGTAPIKFAQTSLFWALPDFACDFLEGGSRLQALSRALPRALSCRRKDVPWRSTPKSSRVAEVGELFARGPAAMSLKAPSRLTRLSQPLDSASVPEAGDARENSRINANDGIDKVRDKARDKENHTQIPEAPLCRNACGRKPE